MAVRVFTSHLNQISRSNFAVDSVSMWQQTACRSHKLGYALGIWVQSEGGQQRKRWKK